ncbi:MAG: glycolate oxidase subunit GlcE [Gammaproteobacteria bacterium]|nr:glycolate oxidase subunit GlcE [Gammaproteobacteria bacterium]
MTTNRDISEALQAEVIAAIAHAEPLCLRGGGSLDFYGRTPTGRLLEVGGHRGIVHYAPSELVVTARAGTPIAEIERTLAEHGQILAFEPPRYSGNATLGGVISANLSGPRRVACGAARDSVLGCRIINGRSEILSFGGEVMKNVAGFDVSRLMTGALGTLGILLEVSLRTLPRPQAEATHVVDAGSAAAALAMLTRLRASPLPISASAIVNDTLYLRLSGSPAGVAAAEKSIGGDVMAEDKAALLWTRIRDHEHHFFEPGPPLWRLSVPADMAPPETEGLFADDHWLIEWDGQLRWLRTEAPPKTVFTLAAKAGGHATAFRHQPARDEAFQPLAAPLMALQRRIKAAFDPDGIFNPGRIHADPHSS